MLRFIDTDNSWDSVYVMCDCHCDMLAFHTMADVSDKGFFLNCYQTVGQRRAKKFTTGEFYFDSPEKATGFANILLAASKYQLKEEYKAEPIYDFSYNEKTILRVTYDMYSCIIQKFQTEKRKECIWEIILKPHICKKFADNILEIIEKDVKKKAAAIS